MMMTMLLLCCSCLLCVRYHFRIELDEEEEEQNVVDAAGVCRCMLLNRGKQSNIQHIFRLLVVYHCHCKVFIIKWFEL